MGLRIMGRHPAAIGEARVRKLARLTARVLGRESDDIGLVFVGPGKMRELNSAYRQKDKPTDVLSFPAESEGDLGDVFICASEAAKKAAARGMDAGSYLALLVVHSVLHLGGHDHAEEKEAAAMGRLENKILKQDA